jgi:long-chain-fatty-acid--[acyl-carrier-protein] ligase
MWIAYGLTKALLSIRYRIRVKGLETLTKENLNREGGILFLPNHPAEIDPVVVVVALWQKFKPRPIVVEHFFYLKGAHFLMKLVKALPLPDMNGMVSKWKQKKIEKLFHLVAEELKKGENFLIYPAGKLKLTAAEIIGGASFVHSLLKECPKTNVVLIRTTGLWGSRFSRALTGTTPSFGAACWEGIKLVLKNGIFLTPRRDILIEVQAAPKDFPYEGTRLEVNQYIEKWYNINGPEPLKLVSDLFWKKKFPEVTVKQETKEERASFKIDPEVELDLLNKMSSLSKKPLSEITRQSHLARDLGLDSLDVAQIYVFLDERYNIEGLHPGQLQTVDDVLHAASKDEAALREKTPTTVVKTGWPNESSRPAIAPPRGKTLMESFFKVCDVMDGHIACADHTLGVMSYRRLKIATLILARRIQKMEGKNIGILMPSTIASYLLIFATLIAKKVPVMLNWTVGVRSLDHAVKVADLKTVLSSRHFLNNLNNGDLGNIDDLLVLIEDVKEEVPFTDKLASFYGLIKDADALLEDFDLLDVKESDPAVILFTSGTESLPKAVPLSHHNILANQASAISCVDFQTRDILYASLPPFHSFGFAVTGVLPLLAGMRAFYAPDPTDSRGMAFDIERWHATILCSAPTFIRGLFHVAKPHQLDSLRYIVSGAEKTPEELFEYVEKMGGKREFLEGYGITECGPVVSLTRPGKPRKGVGQPIPGVELKIFDIDDNGEGEIGICGPNVFSGYLGISKNPFIEEGGKRWYRSGDRGRIDTDGTLILAGRIKRFVKIGAEMVSLSGLEDELTSLAHEKKWPTILPKEGPVLAVSCLEKESEKPQIILFATFDISRDEVNDALRDRGYGRIVKIAEVRKLDQIPQTATGKTHYRALDENL